MRRLGGIALVAALIMTGGKAAAESKEPDGPKMSLYHMAGVDPDIVRGDLVYCFDIAGLAMSSRTAEAGSMQYGVIGALLNSWWGSKGTKRMRQAGVDRCMLAHGYRVIRVPDGQWRQALDLDKRAKLNPSEADPAVVDALAEFASSPIPAEMEAAR